jgi:hypothetical protein
MKKTLQLLAAACLFLSRSITPLAAQAHTVIRGMAEKEVGEKEDAGDKVILPGAASSSNSDKNILLRRCKENACSRQRIQAECNRELLDVKM